MDLVEPETSGKPAAISLHFGAASQGARDRDSSDVIVGGRPWARARGEPQVRPCPTVSRPHLLPLSEDVSSSPSFSAASPTAWSARLARAGWVRLPGAAPGARWALACRGQAGAARVRPELGSRGSAGGAEGGGGARSPERARAALPLRGAAGGHRARRACMDPNMPPRPGWRSSTCMAAWRAPPCSSASPTTSSKRARLSTARAWRTWCAAWPAA